MVKKNSFIIPLAWPDSLVNSSYKSMDPIWKIVRISKHNYYKVGHAAMLLVNGDSGEVQYFDFGRYIAPNGYGRIRGVETDPELKFSVKAICEGEKILNFNEILHYVDNNRHTHGEGDLYAGVYPGVNFDEVLNIIHQMQSKILHEYGPFVIKGTNCSRFVAQTIAKLVDSKDKIKFLYPWYLTPSPLGNIYNCPSKEMYVVRDSKVSIIKVNSPTVRFRILRQKVFFTKNDSLLENLDLTKRTKFDPAKRPENVSVNAQWLGGTGAGAWHEVVKKTDKGIVLKRVQGSGFVDFEYEFSSSLNNVGEFLLDKPYEIEYGTTFKRVFISQNESKFTFDR
jgi:hypothetical protein